MSLHPSVAAVRLAVRRGLDDLPAGAVVVVACSGGADSLALLSAAVHEGHRRDLHVVGATVDHGLQAGSADRADRVVVQMAGLGADETIAARVTVTAEGVGPEAAARQARYVVLDEIAQRLDAAAVLLGHTRDDQAETVLLGLARGSGGRSLGGHAPVLRGLPPPAARRRTGRHRHRLPGRGDRDLGGPAQRRPRLPPGPGPRPGAADARGRARPGRRRHAGPHRRPAPDRHGPPRRPRGPRPRRGGGPAPRRRRSARCRPPYAAGCCGSPPSVPVRLPRSCSTSTCSPSTPCSPTGTGRSGSTCPGTCAPLGAATRSASSRAADRPVQTSSRRRAAPRASRSRAVRADHSVTSASARLASWCGSTARS